MASEEQKFIHSKRILKKDASLRRQTKIAKTFGVDHFVKEPHRMHKHHALDCGISDCIICHGKKAKGERTVQEKRIFQDKLHFESAKALFDLNNQGNENFGHLIEAYEKENGSVQKTLEIPKELDR